MRTIIALLIAAFTLTHAANCGPKAGNSACPESEGCCSSDYHCGVGPFFCGGGCQAPWSAPGACWTKPTCRNINVDFTRQPRPGTPSVLLPLGVARDNVPKASFYLDTGIGLHRGGDKGLEMRMVPVELPETATESGQMGKGVRISSTFYVDYGSITAEVKMANGSGVVSSFITMSDEKDEIDFEWVGKDPYSVQTNYFYQGQLDYSKGMLHPFTFDLSADFHRYTIQWSESEIKWLVDDQVVRTVKRQETLTTEPDGTSLERFPHRVSRVQFGIWDGGSANSAQGTRDWSGYSNWAQSPDGVSAFVRSAKVECQHPTNQQQFESGALEQEWSGVLALLALVTVFY